MNGLCQLACRRFTTSCHHCLLPASSCLRTRTSRFGEQADVVNRCHTKITQPTTWLAQVIRWIVVIRLLDLKTLASRRLTSKKTALLAVFSKDSCSTQKSEQVPQQDNPAHGVASRGYWILRSEILPRCSHRLYLEFQIPRYSSVYPRSPS